MLLILPVASGQYDCQDVIIFLRLNKYVELTVLKLETITSFIFTCHDMFNWSWKQKQDDKTQMDQYENAISKHDFQTSVFLKLRPLLDSLGITLHRSSSCIHSLKMCLKVTRPMNTSSNINIRPSNVNFPLHVTCWTHLNSTCFWYGVLFSPFK